MKGDNVIEAYCPVCNRSLTLFDVQSGYTEKVDGKLTCIHHLERARTLFSNLMVLDALVILLEKKTLEEFQALLKETALKIKVSESDLQHAIKAFCSRVRGDQWQSSKKY
jgi:hypothetical protein